MTRPGGRLITEAVEAAAMAGGGEGTASTAAGAFELLANDRRMAIMETLWEQREPMPFSDLREAVGIADSGQFNYHLGKLAGLYVRETDGGYELTRPGRRVLTAVLAGDLLDRPEVSPARVDWPCPRCGADVELRFDDEMLRLLCTECPGFFRGEAQSRRERRENPHGTISILPIPPAGVKDRSPEEALVAGIQWITHRARMFRAGMCPECSGAVDTQMAVCAEHEPEDGLCGTCGNRHAGLVDMTCETCGEGMSGLLAAATWTDPTVLSFFDDHGYDLGNLDKDAVRVAPTFEETVRSVEPLDYEMRWTLDGETLAVRIDDDLEVIDTTRTEG